MKYVEKSMEDDWKKLSQNEKIEKLKTYTTSVSCLRDVIRDKYEHSGDFPPEAKESLGWFAGDVLDEEKFIQYWLDRFPELFIFLWKMTYVFRDSLPEYYSNSDFVSINEQLTNPTLNTTANMLESLLLENFDNGNFLILF